MGIADNTKRTQVTRLAIFIREACHAGSLSPILSIHNNKSAFLNCLFETDNPKYVHGKTAGAQGKVEPGPFFFEREYSRGSPHCKNFLLNKKRKKEQSCTTKQQTPKPKEATGLRKTGEKETKLQSLYKERKPVV